MSALVRFKELPRWARAMVVVGTVGALLISLLLLTREKKARAPVQARTGQGGMADMPGMTAGAAADGTVTLTAAQLREFGITYGTVERRVLSEQVRAAGIVAFDETRVTALAPKFAGTVERVYVGFSGAPVRAGQPLVDVYSPELLAAQEEMLVASRVAQDLLNAAEARLRLLDISEAQIEQVLRSQQSRRTLTLYARAGGVVVEKNAVAGEAFQAGQLLYRIADLSTVWLDAEIREADAAQARTGSMAEVEFAGLPGRVVRGRVDYVYPTVEDKARTLRARIRIANPGGIIRPGMYATVRITVPVRTALTIPASALVRTGERDLVFVDMGGGRIMPHEVLIGRITDDYAEVLSGVEPGQRVVTSAQFLLDSESNVAEVMKSMIGQTGQSGTSGMNPEGGDMNQPGADMRGMKMPEQGR